MPEGEKGCLAQDLETYYHDKRFMRMYYRLRNNLKEEKVHDYRKFRTYRARI